MAHATPDGYTLFVGSNGPLTVNPFVQAKLGYDPLKDFAPVALTSYVPHCIILNDKVEAKTLPELIALSKKQPINIATSGVGSATHMTLERFKAATGANITHIPYASGGALMPDLIGGTIQAAMTEFSTALPLHKGGKAHIVAVASAQRSQARARHRRPSSRAASRISPRRAISASWRRPKTPPAIVAQLQKAIAAGLTGGPAADKLRAMGSEIATPEQMTPAGFAAFIRTDYEHMREAAKLAGIDAEMSGALPRGACDCHCHVFGPAARFPYAEPRSYTPDDAPLEAYLALLDRLGFDRGVLVQPSAYGRDNRGDARCADARAASACAASRSAARELDAGDAQAMARGRRARLARQRIPPRRQALLPERRRPQGDRAAAAAASPSSAGICSCGSMRATCRTWRPRWRACRCRWWSITWAGWNIITARSNPGFQALLRGVGEGRLWAKLSGTYRLGATPPDYAQARPFHDALVAANPQNLVWGTDWPHPRPGRPGAGRRAPAGGVSRLDAGGRPCGRRSSADNPARLYDFPPRDYDRHEAARRRSSITIARNPARARLRRTSLADTARALSCGRRAMLRCNTAARDANGLLKRGRAPHALPLQRRRRYFSIGPAGT